MSEQPISDLITQLPALPVGLGHLQHAGLDHLTGDAGWRVYDEYLKANRVEEGVRNYGLVLTLLARARFDDGWVPVLK